MDSKGVISLLGCGWLGFPLAKSLISRGFTVKATTTTFSKLKKFENAGIDPYLVQFSDAVQVPDLKKFFDAEILIITIPPGRRDPNGFDNYRRMIRFVGSEIPNSKVSKLILISSTSVYSDRDANVNEESSVSPDTESGQLMAETESYLGKQNINLIILRLAGLIGPGRMPGKFFAGKTQIPNGFAPVNLIHLDDAIGILHCLIGDVLASGVFNGCAPSHPTKEEFYTRAAEVEDLMKPDFVLEKTGGKTVSSIRLGADLNYHFEIPYLMDWLHGFTHR